MSKARTINVTLDESRIGILEDHLNYLCESNANTTSEDNRDDHIALAELIAALAMCGIATSGASDPETGRVHISAM